MREPVNGDRVSGISPLVAVRRSLITYLEVTKPASVALLVFTAVGTMIVAAKGHGLAYIPNQTGRNS